MGDFDITLDALMALIQKRNDGSIDTLTEMGGVQGLCKILKVDMQMGLASDPPDIEKRKEAFGPNYVPPKSPQTYLDFLKAAFSDFTILMLCGAAIISLALAIFVEKTTTAYAEGIAIMTSVVVVTNVAAVNDWKKQKQFLKLNSVVEDIPILTKRDGEFKDVSIKEIVVGDIVAIRVGDLLCADGVLVEGHNINTDESVLTGEPKLISKSRMKPFLLAGTKVMEGTGSFLVTSVGESTESGQIKVLIAGRKLGHSETTPTDGSAEKDKKEEEGEGGGEEKSVLTAKLDRMALVIGKLGLVLAGICVLIMTLRFCITRYAVKDWDTRCALVPDKMCSSEEVMKLADDPEVGFPLCSSSEYIELKMGGGDTVRCCEESDEEIHGKIVRSAKINGSPCGWLATHLGEFLQFFITGITILVVAIPEGLPLAVTLSLAFSVTKMQDDKNLVKHLDACETMGSATTICSDKTGTLTKNKMTVMKAWLGGKEYGFDGKQSCGTVAKATGDLSDEYLGLLNHGIALNSTADIKWNNEVGMWDQLGNKTEAALLGFCHDLGCNYKDIRDGELYNFVNEEGIKGNAVYMYPFSSTRKRSGIAVSLKKSPEGTGYRLFVKGASEIVLSLCSQQLSGSMGVSPLTENDKKFIYDNVIQAFANRAMRTICLAYRDFPDAKEPEWEMEADASCTGQAASTADGTFAAETRLVLLGLVGIEDPLRDEVPAAIAQCRVAGVDVRMVTGDNLDTAVAIAKGCGILRGGDDLDKDGNPKPNTAMTGPDFRNYVLSKSGKIDQVKFDEVWPHLRVLARSSPSDKYILVSGLNESELYTTNEGKMLGIYPDRQVVAVTGDGTNDAPALKRADVGFAMGITGTEVAKDAADIILMDDNFSSIVKACMWGRNVYDSIAKFLQFQLTVNIVAVTLSAIGSVRSSESPLKAVQMLWVNLIMDSLASLALATEPPTPELLQRPPYGRNRTLISSMMRFNMFGQAIYQVIVLGVVLFSGPTIWGFEDGSGQGHLAPPSIHYTLIFNAFVMMQLFNQVSCRKLYHELNLLKGIFDNKIFLIILFIEFAGQVVIVEFGGAYFKTRSLPLEYWMWSFILGAGSWPWQFLIILLAKFVGVTSHSNSNKSGRSYVATVPEVGVDEKRLSDSKRSGEGGALGHISAKVVAGLAQMSSKSIGGMFDTPTEEKLQHQISGGYFNSKRVEINNSMVKSMSTYGATQNEKLLRHASKG